MAIAVSMVTDGMTIIGITVGMVFTDMAVSMIVDITVVGLRTEELWV